MIKQKKKRKMVGMGGRFGVLCAQNSVHGAADSRLESLRGPVGPAFAEHQLLGRMREAQQKRESWVDCARGDSVKILDFADMVEAAFVQSDARWQESLKGYLGSSAVVEQADAASVRVRHADGQTLWWPYGAVKVVSKQPGTHSRQVLSVVTAYSKHASALTLRIYARRRSHAQHMRSRRPAAHCWGRCRSPRCV